MGRMACRTLHTPRRGTSEQAAAVIDPYRQLARLVHLTAGALDEPEET